MTRSDGRTSDQLRPISFERHWSAHAEGSTLVSFGKTKVLCTASFTPGVPRWLKDSGTGWVTAEYAMLPRATTTRNQRESVKGKLGGRTQEISRLIGRSLRAVVDMSVLGENSIVIDCDVLQADGGTRTTAITGASVAVVAALNALQRTGNLKTDPLISMVSAVSVGMWQGMAVLDLDYPEDSTADSDINVVMLANGGLIEVQGTAEEKVFSRAELNTLLDLAESAGIQLHAAQTAALAAS